MAKVVEVFEHSVGAGRPIQCCDRERTANIHMDDLKGIAGTGLRVGIGLLWVFTDEAWDVMGMEKRTAT